MSMHTTPGRRPPREDATAERLYAEYSERLLGFCLKQLGSRSEAEDAVQVTFLCALRALRRGVVPESESAWLYTIARNVCRWQQRTASRRRTDGGVDVEALAPAAATDETDVELLSGLEEALGTLPESQRHALLLREWRGLSASEIAEHLHLSTPATHALLTRARRSLAHALTAPQRAATGLATLVYELRGWIKATVGGASAKAAVATITAVGVGVGVGGVAVEQAIGVRKSPRQPVESAVPAASGSPIASRTGGAASSPVSGAASARREGPASERPTHTSTISGRARVTGGREAFRGRTRPGADPAPTSGPASEPGGSPGRPPNDPLAGVSVSAPRAPDVPAVEPPAVDVPPVDVPPVDVPPVDLPPVDVPPVDLPPVQPPVDLPPVDLPPVDLPPVDVPPVDLPPVDLPPLP